MKSPAWELCLGSSSFPRTSKSLKASGSQAEAFDRSHAPRGNAGVDAPASICEVTPMKNSPSIALYALQSLTPSCNLTQERLKRHSHAERGNDLLLASSQAPAWELYLGSSSFPRTSKSLKASGSQAEAFDRSHAPRGNAGVDAPASICEVTPMKNSPSIALYALQSLTPSCNSTQERLKRHSHAERGNDLNRTPEGFKRIAGG